MRSITKCIDVAKTIYNDKEMRRWKTSRSALDAHFDFYRERSDRFSENVVLIKAAAVNQLYFAGNRWLLHSVENIVNLDAKGLTKRINDGERSVVDDIAFIMVDDRPHHLMSFASKFAHFENPKAYPIFDSYAVNAIKRILESEDFCREYGIKRDAVLPFSIEERSYERYADAVFVFSDCLDGDYSLADIDCFLWLYGQYLAYMKKGKPAKLSGDVEEVFSTQGDLAAGLCHISL